MMWLVFSGIEREKKIKRELIDSFIASITRSFKRFSTLHRAQFDRLKRIIKYSSPRRIHLFILEVKDCGLSYCTPNNIGLFIVEILRSRLIHSLRAGSSLSSCRIVSAQISLVCSSRCRTEKKKKSQSDCSSFSNKRYKCPVANSEKTYKIKETLFGDGFEER